MNQSTQKKIPKWLKKKRMLIPAFFLLTFICFLSYLKIREGKSYKGELAALLPVTTSAFISLDDLQGLIQNFTQTSLYRQYSEDPQFIEVLLQDEEVQDLKQDIEQIPTAIRGKLLLTFINRYFGKQAVAALVSFKEIPRPAILIMTQTDLGFSERIAELCAEIYPEIQLETQDFQGYKIYIYRQEKSNESFTYARLGKTIVLSLQSENPEYLKRLIENQKSSQYQTLDQHPPFQNSITLQTERQGLSAYLNPTLLFTQLINFTGEEYLSKRLNSPLNQELKSIIENFETAVLSLNLKNNIQLKLTLNGSKINLPEPVDISAVSHLNIERTRAAKVSIKSQKEYLKSALNIIARLLIANKNEEFYNDRLKLEKYKPEKRKKKEKDLQKDIAEFEALLKSIGNKELFNLIFDTLDQSVLLTVDSFGSALLPIPQFFLYSKSNQQKLQTFSKAMKDNQNPETIQQTHSYWNLRTWQNQILILPYTFISAAENFIASTSSFETNRFKESIKTLEPEKDEYLQFQFLKYSPFIMFIHPKNIFHNLESITFSPLRDQHKAREWWQENLVWLKTIEKVKYTTIHLENTEKKNLQIILTIPIQN